MTREYADGSIQSANLPVQRNTAKLKDFALYRAMILDYAYADDMRNNPTAKAKTADMIYTVVVLGGYREGQIISGVRLSKLLGGQYNYHNQRLQKTTKPAGTPLKDHDGDIVYLQFVQGDTDYPVITSFGVNAQSNYKLAIKKADGPVYRWQYNGVYEGIDKLGNLNIKIKGGAYDQAKDLFTPAEAAAIDIVFDPTAETYTRTYKSGLIVKEDSKNQKIEVTNGSTKTLIDGKANKITLTAGSTVVEIDGGGKVKLLAANIDLGNSVSDFVTMFTELTSAFNAHQHTGNLGAPTSPPNAPLLSSVGSQTVKVQA